MNIALVNHGSPKEYAFSVPNELVPYVKKGVGVLCETIYGLTYGTATTGVISGVGAMDIAEKNGAYLPLRPIVGFAHKALGQSPEIREAASAEWFAKVQRLLE